MTRWEDSHRLRKARWETRIGIAAQRTHIERTTRLHPWANQAGTTRTLARYASRSDVIRKSYCSLSPAPWANGSRVVTVLAAPLAEGFNPEGR